MAEFQAAVYQNEFLPDGGTDVNAIVTLTCTGAGVAGQTGSGAAGEIIIIDNSGSMGVASMEAAKQAAQAAVAEIVDGTWFSVIAGNGAAFLAYPPRHSRPWHGADERIHPCGSHDRHLAIAKWGRHRDWHLARSCWATVHLGS
ncbi:MAG: hypothetical protein V9E81_03065 [Marmoricola sp.]